MHPELQFDKNTNLTFTDIINFHFFSQTAMYMHEKTISYLLLK